MRPDLPPPEQAERIAQWLAGPRGRLLRRVQIGLRRRVLEIGCGHGTVTRELVRRAGGEVVALDRRPDSVGHVAECGAMLVGGDARALPFGAERFDLVFYENVLLWVAEVDAAIAEAARVLAPKGALVALEPDYGGMMEYPPEVATRDLWLAGIRRAGGDPEVGRRLPGACERVGLTVWVELQNLPSPAEAETVQMLEGLPLTEEETQRARSAERALRALPKEGMWAAFVYVPYVLVAATRPEQ